MTEDNTTTTTTTTSDGHSIKFDLTDEEINDLATYELNGREIKNVVKTARTWCLAKGVDLTVDKMRVSIIATAPLATKAEMETKMEM